jgi:hypothetical protein
MVAFTECGATQVRATIYYHARFDVQQEFMGWHFHSDGPDGLACDTGPDGASPA